ncbi:MAG: response regulator [Actinomycetota bacterium]
MTELTVVVVDDDPFDRELLTATLEKLEEPVRPLFFTDGVEAAEALENGLHPDLVLVDLNLPGISGIELIKRLRANASCAALHLVVLTSSGTSWDARSAYDAGADAYHVKPFDVHAMRHLLETTITYWGRLVRRRPGDRMS